VIARTFDRVCAVLDRLGYLAGDTVTADGQRLAGLYTELDLLAAQCMRQGLWDGLNPAELAACVSALSFESRQPDDAHPPRLPKGRVPEALSTMVRTWGELDQLEKDHDLSFLREPDLGFAWAAYRWARGATLESVLEGSPDLTPGDFVRSVKQLIDLLDQISKAAARPPADPPAPATSEPPESLPAPAESLAPATSEPSKSLPASADLQAPADSPVPSDPSDPPVPARSPDIRPAPRSLSATARAAIDAMRRGVVAYSAVAD
jgi:hypothetical protein